MRKEKINLVSGRCSGEHNSMWGTTLIAVGGRMPQCSSCSSEQREAVPPFNLIQCENCSSEQWVRQDAPMQRGVHSSECNSMWGSTRKSENASGDIPVGRGSEGVSARCRGQTPVPRRAHDVIANDILMQNRIFIDIVCDMGYECSGTLYTSPN